MLSCCISIKMFLSLLCCFFAILTPAVISVDPTAIKWSNSWAVEIRGGRDKADQIAAKYDFINLGQVSCHISLTQTAIYIIVAIVHSIDLIIWVSMFSHLNVGLMKSSDTWWTNPNINYLKLFILKKMH